MYEIASLKIADRLLRLIVFCLTGLLFGAFRAEAAGPEPVGVTTAGSAPHLHFGAIGEIQFTNVSTPILISAVNESNAPLAEFNNAFALEAFGATVKAPKIVISEVVREQRDAVEFVNASAQTQNLNGWRIVIFDGQSATQKLTFSFTNDVNVAPGEIFVLRESGFGPALPVKEFSISPVINWVRLNSGVAASVLIEDANSNIVDFVSIGLRPADQLVYDRDIDFVEWRGASVAGASAVQTTWSRQRVGAIDTSSGNDWVSRTPQIGQANSGLVLPFTDGFGRLDTRSENQLILTNGAWSGSLKFDDVGTNVFLEAWIRGTNISGRSSTFAIQGKPFLFLEGSSVTEGDGLRTNALLARLQVPRSEPTSIALNTESEEITVPETIVIPAGEHQVVVPITVLDDALLDGSQKAIIGAVADGMETVPGVVTIFDNESALLTLSGTNSITEGGTASMVVHASASPQRDVELDFTVSGPVPLRANGPVILRAGTREVAFDINAADDQVLNSLRQGSVAVTVANWTGATNQITVRDNEARNLTVLLPPTISEDAGVLTNRGAIVLGGNTETNLPIELSLGISPAISVPGSVFVPAGASNISFNITAINDTVPNTNRPVLLNARAEGFESGSATTLVINEDPSTFQVLLPFGIFTVGVPFNATVHAAGTEGEKLTNGSYSVSLQIRDAEGLPVGSVVNVPLQAGTGTIAITPDSSVIGAYLKAEAQGASGESRRFNILEPVERIVSGIYRDVVALPGTADLLASVPSETASNANEIVRIDSETGAVETWLAAENLFSSDNPHSGEMAISPDGQYLFAIAGNGTEVRAWKLADKTLVRTLIVPTRTAENIAVATAGDGMARLLVSTGWETYIFSLDGSVQLNNRSFESGIGHPERVETFYVFHPYALSEWRSSSAGIQQAIELQSGPFQEAHIDLAVAGSRLFTISGGVIDMETRQRIGELPVPSVLAARFERGRLAEDRQRNEILRTYPDGTVTRIESFGAADLQLHNEAVLPLQLNQIRRLLVSGTNRLALLNGTDLRFVRWPATGVGELVDLEVSADTPAGIPRVGESWDLRVRVENRGPIIASDVSLEIPVGKGFRVTNVSAPGGEFQVGTNEVIVHWPILNASNIVEATFTIVPEAGGFLDFDLSARANEREDDFSNNVLKHRLFVAPGSAAESVTRLQLPLRDLAYDSVRHRIYALELNATSATNTILYEIDPETFLPRELRILPGYASHLRVSADGEYLHSAVLGGRAAIRIQLGEQLVATQYALGGTGFQLLAFEVSPVDSSAVVVAGATELQESVLWEMTVTAINDGVIGASQVTYQLNSRPYSAFLGVENSSAYLAVYPQNEVRRIEVGPGGVMETGRYIRPHVAAGFALVDGIMYTSFSDELRATSGKFLRGVPTEAPDNYALVKFQSASNRLIYLQLKNDQSTSLQVFDRSSLASLGSMHIPATGGANSLVDLGDGRAAIAFSSGAVFFVSTGLLGGAAAKADLEVSIGTHPVSPRTGDNVEVRVVARNNGPSSAVSPGVAVELPFGFSYHFTNIVPRASRIAGEFQTASLLLWTNVQIAPGTSVTNIVRGVFTEAGNYQLIAGIADRTEDLVSTNNRAALPLSVPFRLGAGEFGLTSHQIIGAGWDATRNRIIAGTSALSSFEGRVLAINPLSGLVEETYDFGSNPTAMSLADDSDTIYLAVDGGTNIARARLSTGQVEATFSGMFPEVGEQRSIYWLGANPGRPDQVFVRADNGLALFSGNQLVASTNYSYGALGIYRPNALVHPADYAPHPINRVHFRDGGFVFSQGGPEFMNNLRAGDGILVADDGRIVDGESFTLLGQVNGFGPAIISGDEGVVYKFGFTDQRTVRAFDLLTQSLLWESPVANAPQAIDGLEAGPEYLAYRLEDSRLMIIRKKTAETNPPVDLTLSLRTDTSWQAGAIGEWQVALDNLGPNQSPGTRVDLRLPEGFRAVQVRGASVLSDKTNHLSLAVGVLPPGGGAVVQIEALADRAYTAAEVVASVRSTASDLDRTNNTARLVHAVKSSSVPNLIETLAVPGSDLVYDRAAKKLYIAGLNDDGIISSNLTVLDPFTGQEERTITLQGQPVRLAISPESEFLYVALNGGARIERYALPSLEFDLGFDIPTSAWFKVDMIVPHGTPRTVIVSLHGAFTPSPAGVRVYDDGQPRPQGIEGGGNGVTLIEPGATPDELIALGDTVAVEKVIRRYRITPAGLEFVDERPHHETPFALAASAGTVLTWPSGLYDAASLNYRGALTNSFDPVSFHPEAIALSANGLHAVLAANVGTAVRFEGFRTDAMTSSGIAEVPISGKVRALTLWETDGIAALAGNSLVLGRLDLAAAPLEIRQFDPNSLRVIFPVGAGRRWILERAPTPTGPWSEAAEATSSGGLQVVPVTMAGQGNAFFRVVLQAAQ